MSTVHGRNTVIKINSKNISPYCNASEITRGADAHDNTGYGKNAHTFNGGLLNNTITLGGTYDNTASVGPRAAIEPLVGTLVPFIRQTEGAGSGKPQNSCTVLVTEYKESNPVADNVQWTASLQVSDVIDDTPQP